MISHGNGPQVGLLALQGSAYTEVEPYPLDLLGAQTEGMIGYMIQQELGNELPFEKRLASLLTLIEVDRNDPAFEDPTKPIGPIYTEDDAKRLADEKGWIFKPDGDSSAASSRRRCRRRIFGIEPVEWLLEHDCVVICAGGGGIPVMYTDEPAPAGRQARRGRGGDRQGPRERTARARPQGRRAADRHGRRRRLLGLGHARAARDPACDAGGARRDGVRRGLDGAKVRAACSFVEQTGGLAAIGSINDTPALLRGEAGTVVTRDAPGSSWQVA